ncbi:hypothetical protein BDFB_015154 [Asbolus verrucosus]|uniref:Uncharacterized protein n=1 Tax=Asbolus verrucosus TaxID=1661398 RepID=A0A482WC63_ASBVE|nr:hypothetical protein BDFB_015154 [Asbolus verrucosus]
MLLKMKLKRLTVNYQNNIIQILIKKKVPTRNSKKSLKHMKI